MGVRLFTVAALVLAATGCTKAPCADRCLRGCCDPATGACLPGTSSKQCGADMGLCGACAPGEFCADRACVALVEPDGGACARSCEGCCIGERCVDVRAQDALGCGSNGAMCATCGVGQLCAAGECRAPRCNPGNCSIGCCSGDTCLPEGVQGNDQCGNSGLACDFCPLGSGCADGGCRAQCRPNSCAGCCQGNTCLPYAGQSAAACEVVARQCKACAGGQSCLSGFCSAGCQRSASFEVTSRKVEGVGADFYFSYYGGSPTGGGRLLLQLRTPIVTPKTWVLSQSNYHGPQFMPDLPRVYVFSPCTPANCTNNKIYAAVEGQLTVSALTGSLDAGTLTASATGLRFVPWESATTLQPATSCWEYDAATLSQTWP